MARRESPLKPPRFSLPPALAALIQADPPRARSLLATLLGDSIAPYGSRIWLGTLIALLDALGVNERLTRTSVFRLVEDGWLIGQRSGRRSLYALTPTGLRHIEHAQRRIYAPSGAAWDGRWTLILIAPQAGDARARLELKRELAWEGFALLAPGVYGHPSYHPESVREILRALDAEALATLFCGETTGSGEAGELVARSWPIEALALQYQDFVERLTPLGGFLEKLDARESFVARTLLIHAYRRLVLHDPQLPASLLPGDWAGHRAYALCQRLYRALAPRSEEFLLACIVAESGTQARKAASYFARFEADANPAAAVVQTRPRTRRRDQ
jgi:phenylacetic acid degradation operon negative regulatory protein